MKMFNTSFVKDISLSTLLLEKVFSQSNISIGLCLNFFNISLVIVRDKTLIR